MENGKKTSESEKMNEFIKDAYEKKASRDIENASLEGIFGLGQLFFYLTRVNKKAFSDETIVNVYKMMEEHVKEGCAEEAIPGRYYYLAKKSFGGDSLPTPSPFDAYPCLFDPERGLKYLQMALDRGNAEASCFYGSLLATGTYINKDPEKGMAILSEVGRRFYGCYEEVGRALMKAGDEAGALRYFELGKDRGNEDCAIILAQLYLFKSAKKDEDAFKILKSLDTNAQSDSNVPYMLSYCYAYGRGVTKDIKEARGCYARAFSPSYIRQHDIEGDPLKVETVLE